MPSVSRSTTTWTANSGTAKRRAPRNAEGVWNTPGRKRGPAAARIAAHTTPSAAKQASALAMLVVTPRSSSSAARSAMVRVAAVPMPRSTSENQPVMAEKV